MWAALTALRALCARARFGSTHSVIPILDCPGEDLAKTQVSDGTLAGQHLITIPILKPYGYIYLISQHKRTFGGNQTVFASHLVRYFSAI